MPKQRPLRSHSKAQKSPNEQLNNNTLQDNVQDEQEQSDSSVLAKQVQSLQATVVQLTKLVQDTNNAVGQLTKNSTQQEKAGDVRGGPIHDNQQPSTSEIQLTEQVEEGIVNHLQFVMAEDMEGDQFKSCSIPLDLNVTDKIKSAIWADQYVEFSKLNDPDVPGEYDLRLIPGSNGGQIKLTPAKDTNVITNIGQWSKAFHVYMSVYTQRFPDQTRNLLIYENKIRHLAFIGGDWIRYDQQFRKLKSKNPIHWGKTQMELWIECNRANPYAKQSFSYKQAGRAKGSRPFSRPGRGGFRGNQSFRAPRHPPGTCFEFHDGGKCNKKECSFSHTCYKPNCNGNHPVFQCRNGGFKAQNAGNKANFASSTNNFPNQGVGRGQGFVKK
jgi:hypothetical protein